MTFSLHSRFIEAAKCDSYSRRLSQVFIKFTGKFV